jgi:hypothetical protein
MAANRDLGRSRPGLTAYLSLLHRPVGRWLLISALLDGWCLFAGALPYIGAFVIQEFDLSLGIAGLLVTGVGLGPFAYPGAARHLGERRLLLLGATGSLPASPAWPGHRPGRTLLWSWRSLAPSPQSA